MAESYIDKTRAELLELMNDENLSLDDKKKVFEELKKICFCNDYVKEQMQND
jgi:hypothetical protein